MYLETARLDRNPITRHLVPFICLLKRDKGVVTRTNFYNQVYKAGARKQFKIGGGHAIDYSELSVTKIFEI